MSENKPTSVPQMSQTKITSWSDAELRRVSRVFDLLVRIDQRLMKGTRHEEVRSQQTTKTPTHESDDSTPSY